MNEERRRLISADREGVPWRRWGPYLSERQWGTVREDYSPNGDAWEYFPHDHARSRAYRWGEDGLAGLSDDRQHLCFALALWNGADPILKERLFGLTNAEGNHGEDVKECYYYLDSTPTHSYMKYLYKYPQTAFPYVDLVETNRRRTRHDPEYELLDTGVFNDNRYFDVVVEYAKHAPDDIAIRITVSNRGPDAATLHVLPTLWFRNTWSWAPGAARPRVRALPPVAGAFIVEASHESVGTRYLFCLDAPALMFTDNDTNQARIFGTDNPSPFVKDAFDRYLVHAEHDAINIGETGTKSAALYPVTVGAGQDVVLRMRLTDLAPADVAAAAIQEPLSAWIDTVIASRQAEADDFYGGVIPATATVDEGLVIRQALAGMLWSKQFYYYDVDRWLKERGPDSISPRNAHWRHMVSSDIISMPDKWEYPWFAAWDLAFHVLALSMVDGEFSKGQLSLMLHRRYLHPNGQMPAYEWNFGDVNPPVHAWATLFTYRLEKASLGRGDLEWLERSFQKLVMNFTWWVNRKDREGNNVFEGGFLGLDNVGLFDRSKPLPTGGHLEQADGTAWMALYSLNMLEMALELSANRALYVDMAQKFFEHFLTIASAMVSGRGGDFWDEDDGFFYDVLQLPNGETHRLKVRSLVGLMPLCAVAVVEPEDLEHVPDLVGRLKRFIEARPELIGHLADPQRPGVANRRLLSVLDEHHLRRVLATMLDEAEFLGPFGIRSLSRYHQANPYVWHVEGREYRVDYLPAESDSGMFGGNSNWRGPVWMPANALVIRALIQYYAYYGDTFTVECPTGSGHQMTLMQVAREISRRLAAIFVRNDAGERPVHGGNAACQHDPQWRDHLLFYEYFHADNGAGLGASHQTGWTGIVARLMQLFESIDDHDEPRGKEATFRDLA